jgi:hypothetical protein
MNFDTDRRTYAVRIAFSRNQAFVDAHNSVRRIRDIVCSGTPPLTSYL